MGRSSQRVLWLAALISLGAAPPGCWHSPGSTDPLVLTHGYESAGGAGPWLGRRGMIEPYEHGGWVSVGFRVRNASGVPLNLLSADDADAHRERRLLRRVGVRFQLAHPDLPHGAQGPTTLQPPFGVEQPRPLKVPPGREAFVQFNFRMGDCRFFPPGAQRTYNRTTTLRYVLADEERSRRLHLEAVRITVTAPRSPDRCA